MNAKTLSGLGARERDYPLPSGPKGEKWAFRIFIGLMALVIIAFLIGVLTGCGPQAGTVPRHVALAIPPKAKAVDVAPVRKSAAEAAREGVIASGNVNRIAREVAGLKIDLHSAVTEADRLRQQKTASEAELQGLWKSLTAISTRNDALITEAGDAREALARQSKLYEQAAADLAQVEREVMDKELEASRLRDTATTSESLRASSDEALATANTVAAKAASKADKLAGETRLWRIVAAIIGAMALIVFLIRRFVLP